MAVLALHELKGVQVAGGRETVFAAGDVEPGDTLVAVSARPARRSPAIAPRTAWRVSSALMVRPVPWDP